MSYLLNKDCEVEKGVFAIEVTTTQSCNFKCTYCFERDFKPEKNTLDSKVIVEKIKELFKDDWFIKEYEAIKIVLWGGEPTLNFSLCEELMKEFIDDEKVCFFIYTNGSKIDMLMPYLIEMRDKPFVKKNMKKFTVQVSYDGNPVNDLCRLTRDGQLSSDIVKDSIEKLYENKIDFGLKSTLSFKDFKLLPLVWDDFEILYNKYGERITYALTVDYFDVKFEEHKVEIEEALLDLSAKEYNFFKKNKRFLSNIFRSNRSVCSTGKNMLTIDTDGGVYYCHGCMYSKNKENFLYSNIYVKTFVRDLEKKFKEFGNIYEEPEDCKNCIATMCLRCNVRKYDSSDKKEFRERWFDYTSQQELCEYYKMVGKIGAAIKSLIEKRGGDKNAMRV